MEIDGLIQQLPVKNAIFLIIQYLSMKNKIQEPSNRITKKYYLTLNWNIFKASTLNIFLTMRYLAYLTESSIFFFCLSISIIILPAW
jgi:hypothetical protein